MTTSDNLVRVSLIETFKFCIITSELFCIVHEDCLVKFEFVKFEFILFSC